MVSAKSLVPPQLLGLVKHYPLAQDVSCSLLGSHLELHLVSIQLLLNKQQMWGLLPEILTDTVDSFDAFRKAK